ncbi:bifunctional 3,4-dihydroxy-2-butanone 4-phosphate synthase/GTP cyclohydrolase II [Helicobacter pametensis]|uniref:bifunctional 3,4-dihydroxy-2-butanone 4-phosphate synthase/GTP cyclohydrolase II n=1 Tax=Helicobacter pametensis TaxID=95149 RepID=UPI00048766BE|nr:bifunctional 3,4-dihydroxy-2-butanone 4-phosphate synthase/GTP cyclohydrolase II [Helicobacter pametensis]
MVEQRVREAIEAFKRGEMLIVMDDEDRENEGDLVYAGIFSTPEKVNFMAREARGLICVSITQELASSLELNPMVSCNDSNHHTAFTVSIDAKEATTGISAYERDMTISLMCNPNSKPSDFVRPGHIFPLVAKEGGVLVRTGHTEASVDLCKLSGLAPVAVICEMMKSDGSMARRGDRFLFDFAQEYQLKILYVSDLVQYRLHFENLISCEHEEEVSLCLKPCKKYLFKDHLDRIYEVFAFEGQGKLPYVRFHHIKQDIQMMQEDFASFMKVLNMIEEEGGFLVCLSEKSEDKSFGIGAQILKHLGVSDFKLLSSRRAIDYSALGGFGVNIVEVICI